MRNFVIATLAAVAIGVKIGEGEKDQEQEVFDSQI